MCDDFHLALEPDSAGCYAFAKNLFEQHSGRLRSLYYNGNTYDRGTGAFGREIDSVGFIFIDEMVLERKEDRRQGFGSAALNSFLEEPRLAEFPFVFVFPSVLTQHDDSRSLYDEEGAALCRLFGQAETQDEGAKKEARELRMQQQARIVSFYRKNGFRRVGNSEYFAYAKDPTHPSRTIAMGNDAAGPPRGRPAELLRKAFPLHAAVADARLTSEMPALEDRIAHAELAEFGVQDDYGETPLHISARKGTYHVVRAILKRSTAELFVRDAKDLTPVEQLERAIVGIEEEGREVMSDIYERGRLKERLLFIEEFSKPLAVEMRAVMASAVAESDVGNAAEVSAGYWKDKPKKETKRRKFKGASPPNVEAKDNTGGPPAGRKRARLSGSRTAVDTSHSENEAESSRGRKKRKLSLQGLETAFESMDDYMHLSSWEDLVRKIITVKRVSRRVTVYMELTDGAPVAYDSEACNERCPVKMLDFYEANLRWVPVNSASPN